MQPVDLAVGALQPQLDALPFQDAVGVEAQKRTFVIDQVLREQACDQRFADATFSPPMKCIWVMGFFRGGE